jgi:hypothetical protein
MNNEHQNRLNLIQLLLAASKDITELLKSKHSIIEKLWSKSCIIQQDCLYLVLFYINISLFHAILHVIQLFQFQAHEVTKNKKEKRN